MTAFEVAVDALFDDPTGHVRAAMAAKKRQARRDREAAEAARRSPLLPPAAEPGVILELLPSESLVTDRQIRAAQQIVASRRAAR